MELYGQDVRLCMGVRGYKGELASSDGVLFGIMWIKLGRGWV
jgi:hypothetical protein